MYSTSKLSKGVTCMEQLTLWEVETPDPAPEPEPTPEPTDPDAPAPEGL